MRLILIGPPGAGKGTQAQLLCMRLGLVHVSTGDILRDAMQRDTPEGRRAKPFMTGGRLVPDDLVNDIVAARFRGADRPTAFIMDGYPRTLAQAVAFEPILKEQGLQLDAVVYLEVHDDEIVRRNSARWTCVNPDCKATYNTLSKPPRTQGRCDLCNHLLTQRDDDKPDTIRRRLQFFHQQQRDILQHYAAKDLLIEIPAVGNIESIYANIVTSLKKRTAV
jgi:adenylate kinase